MTKPSQIFFSQTFPTRAEAQGASFFGGSKKDPIAVLHPLAGRTLKGTVDLQSDVSGKADLSRTYKTPNLYRAVTLHHEISRP